MTELRWKLFKILSAIGWAICPEPHKSRLTSVTSSWDDVKGKTQ